MARAVGRSDTDRRAGAGPAGGAGAAPQGEGPFGLEEHLGHLERLAGSLPEAHTVRLLAEEAVGSARARGAGYAGSAASRSRSKTEGRISTLRGILDRENALASKDA